MLILLLTQSAVAVAQQSDGLGGHATQLAIAAILAINIWQIRATLKFRDDARLLRQWAFGPEGGNGKNSEIDDHEARIAELEGERRHGKHDRRVVT